MQKGSTIEWADKEAHSRWRKARCARKAPVRGDADTVGGQAAGYKIDDFVKFAQWGAGFEWTEDIAVIRILQRNSGEASDISMRGS